MTPAFWVRLNDISTCKIPGVFALPGEVLGSSSIGYPFPSKETLSSGACANPCSFNVSQRPHNVELMSSWYRLGSHGSESLCDLPKVTQQGCGGAWI